MAPSNSQQPPPDPCAAENEVASHTQTVPQTCVYERRSQAGKAPKDMTQTSHILPQNQRVTGASLKPNTRYSSQARANIHELNQSFQVQTIFGGKKHKHLFIPLLANHDLYFGLKNGFSRAEWRVKRVGVGWSPALILLHRASTADVPSLGISCG